MVTWMILKSVMLDEVNLHGKVIHDLVHVRDLKYVLRVDFETAAMMSEVRKGRDEVGWSIGTAAQSERSFVSTVLQTVANDNTWCISHSLRKGLECPRNGDRLLLLHALSTQIYRSVMCTCIRTRRLQPTAQKYVQIRR